MACLFLVPESQDIYRVVGRFVTVQSYIARIAKSNDQFTQLRNFREGTAKVGSRFQQQELSPDGLTGSPGGLRCLGLQELPTPL